MLKQKRQKPLLLGILVDVSGSMVKQLQNERGQTLKRPNVCRSLSTIWQYALARGDEHESDDTRRFGVFLYGFGLRNVSPPSVKPRLIEDIMGFVRPDVARAVGQWPDRCDTGAGKTWHWEAVADRDAAPILIDPADLS